MKRATMLMATLGLAASFFMSVPALHADSGYGATAPSSPPAHAAMLSPHFKPASTDLTSFYMVRSTAVVNAGTGCLPNAYATVVVSRTAQNDLMLVKVTGAAPNTAFDLFVLQLPDKPFGVAWYQSDLQTDAYGSGSVVVAGIFNKETFSISLGGVSGGNQTGATTAVTSTNVTFQPTNQYHLGLWFATPTDAQNNGCPTTVTPFNGAQNAGIQALSTREFPAGLGPLAAIRP